MEKNNIKTLNYLLFTFAFFLPLWPKILPLLIILIIGGCFFTGNYKEKLNNVRQNKFNLLFSSIYILYLIGLSYSENMICAWMDVEIKLPLLLFPLVFSSTPVIEKENIHKIFKGYLIGCTLAALLCLLYALYRYLLEEYNIFHNNPTNHFGINLFLSSRLSIFLHPSYFSMYLCFALAMIFSFLLNASGFSKVLICTGVLFCISILLLASKLGWIVLFIEFILFGIMYINKKQKYKEAIAAMISLLLFFFLIYSNASEIRNKLTGVTAAITSAKIDKTSLESSALRVLVWKAGVNIIEENLLFGTGTGDVTDALLKEYQREGVTGALEHKLNAHNQFLQTFLAIGIIGFLTLVACFVLPFIQSIKSQNYIYLVFLAIIILNFMVESMLETQAGVIFYAFFNSLLFFKSKD